MTNLQPDVLRGTDTPLFSETQAALSYWIYQLAAVVMVVAMGASTVGAVRGGKIAVALWPISIVVVFWVFMWFLRLETRVEKDLVRARVFPLHLSFRKFTWEEIEKHEVVTYRPLRDYGGWGIRLGRNGWAYNMWGTRGVLLYLKKGKTQLIGSQRADELASAIARAKEGAR